MRLGSQIRLFSILFIGVFLQLPTYLHSQELYFVNYQPQDGLPSYMSYSVFQDSKGFVWVSTDLGVSRFDGKNFENYSFREGLTDNEVFNFFEDSQGRIWLHTFNGRPCYFKNEKFHNPGNDSLLQKISLSNYITNITEDSKGRLYISTNGNDGVIINTDNELEPFVNTASYLTMLNFGWIGKDDKFYASHQHGINALGEKTSIFFKDHLPDFLHGFTRGIDAGEIVILGARKHLFIFDKGKEKVIASLKIEEIDTELIHINYINKEIWLGTRNGIYKVTFSDDNFTDYQVEKYLKGYSVSSLLQDVEGNLWFSTLENGIFFSPAPKGLHWNQKNGLAENQTFCLSADTENNLWIGNSKNNFTIQKNKKFNHHKLAGFADLEITKIKHFGNDEHWVIGQGLIVEYNDNNPRYIFVHTDDIIRDKLGVTWFGHKRLVRFSPENLDRIMVTESNPDFRERMAFPVPEIRDGPVVDIKRFTCFENGAEYRMWAGTSKGLVCYEYDKTDVNPCDCQYLVEDKITDLTFDTVTSILWVATNSRGIHAIKNDSIIFSADERQGLTSNMLTSLFVDEDHAIWIGSVKGVDKLELVNGRYVIQNFSKEQGLFDLKSNDILVKDKDVYLATESGIIILPQEVVQKEFKPPIFINRFNVNGRPANLASQSLFKHTENSMEIFFTGLSYLDQGNITYRYRLIGEHDDWQSTKATSINYRSLSPGKYRFEVKASNTHNQESATAAAIDFEIDAPFWLKAWFISLVLAGLFAITFLVWRRRIKNLETKHMLEQRVVYAENDKLELERNFLDLEMRALRLQMNPHFLFNALNTIKGYYAQDKVKEANAYIAKFAQLLRLILKNNDKYISLEKEIKILNFYMQLTQIRYENIFEFDIDVDETLDHQDVAIPPMLLQPMVENAIIHGLAPRKTKGKINIRFEAQDGVLISKVRDNGIGREASRKFSKHKIHDSKATQITQERLAIINKDYQILNYFKIDDLKKNDGSVDGTEVTIKTPLKTIW